MTVVQALNLINHTDTTRTYYIMTQQPLSTSVDALEAVDWDLELGLPRRVPELDIPSAVKSYWTSKEDFFASKGYQLLHSNSGCNPSHTEFFTEAFDRIQDGLVWIQQFAADATELLILCEFSEPSILADPRNHCIPVLDIFDDEQDPEYTFVVMPFLEEVNADRFKTVDDILDYGE